MKLRENVGEDDVIQKTQELVDAMKDDRAQKQQESLKRVAEKYIEDIFLGLKQPKHGMQINIELEGPFTLFGIETTKESSFKYIYPSTDGIEPPEIKPEKLIEDDDELFPVI